MGGGDQWAGEGTTGHRLTGTLTAQCHSASNCPASTWGSFISMTTSDPHRARIAQHVLEGRKEMFYLTTHSTHFIYGYMASDIW